MPFTQLTPRPLTSHSIRMYAPVTSGVYGISNSNEWIYIGAADNIQVALLAHLEDPGAPIMKRNPTGFVYELCEGTHRADRQDRLTSEYVPKSNRPASRYSQGQKKVWSSQKKAS